MNQTTMVSNDETSLYDDMPELEDIEDSMTDNWEQTEDKGINCFQIGCVLAQIELLSCFQNRPKPLFKLLDSELWRAPCL